MAAAVGGVCFRCAGFLCDGGFHDAFSKARHGQLNRPCEGASEDAGMATATIQLLQAAARPELMRNQPVQVGVVHLDSKLGYCFWYVPGLKSRSRVPVGEIPTQ